MLEPEYFAKKRQELGLGRKDILEAVQSVLDGWYPGLARARQLHQGVLRITTASSSVASDLRMRQVELVVECRLEGTRVVISIE
jgi:hypothetical protein